MHCCFIEKVDQVSKLPVRILSIFLDLSHLEFQFTNQLFYTQTIKALYYENIKPGH